MRAARMELECAWFADVGRLFYPRTLSSSALLSAAVCTTDLPTSSCGIPSYYRALASLARNSYRNLLGT